MSVRFFVLSSALMILSWLAVTFFLVVPVETYPLGSVAEGSKGEPADPAVVIAIPPSAESTRVVRPR